MNKDASTTIETLLYECIASREVLEDVLIFNVIDLHYIMLEVYEKIVVKRQPQGRHHMGDVGISQSFFPP